MLSDASASVGDEAALPLPEPQYLAAVTGHRAGSTKSLSRAAADPELVPHFAAALTQWCATVEQALDTGEQGSKDAEDAGGRLGIWVAARGEGMHGCGARRSAGPTSPRRHRPALPPAPSPRPREGA